MLLLALIIYIFSILFTDVVLDHVEHTGRGLSKGPKPFSTNISIPFSMRVHFLLGLRIK